jgi:hypothetical protein
MAWRVERRERSTPPSILVGAAHFFPRHFRRDLRRLFHGARVVLLEGPLDEAATRKVLEAGRGSGGDLLYQANPGLMQARLGLYRAPLDVHQLLKDLVFGRQEQWLEQELRALKPWAAFFALWTRFRARHGWVHALDLDAARIAAEFGRPIVYLEVIEEQIAALEAVPLTRILRFMHEDWSAYCRHYERHYLAGELDALLANAQRFPTYCEPIIEARDPILAQRMAAELGRGGACVVVGVAHCRGVLARLSREGFEATQLS